MGLLPDRSLSDPADRRPAHAAPQAGDEEGGPLTYPDGGPIDLLVHLGREVIGAGLAVGSGGNLSARSPGSQEFLVTASGTWLNRLNRTSFVRVRIADGVAPDGGTPSSEVGLHLAVYRARPDVNAVVHLHPQTAVLLDALGVPLRLITTDHAFYLRHVAVTPWHAPGTPDVGRSVAAAVADGTNCVLLPFHGCAVLGDTVEMAHRRAVNLEEAARLTYQAMLLTGGSQELPSCPADFLTDRDPDALI